MHLRGRRAAHGLEVLRLERGDELRVGVVGGRIGRGLVVAASAGGRAPELSLEVELLAEPPPPPPAQLLLALPRPKVLRRVLQAVAAMGLPRLLLVGSYRVEKSYFASPALDPGSIEEDLLLGLEQGRHTRLPEVRLRRHFKPFVEDELESWLAGAQGLLADPGAGGGLAGLARRAGRAAVAIGPEGGFTPYETGLLRERGFDPFTLGPYPLRVETAVPFAVGQVLLWLGIDPPAATHGRHASGAAP